MNRRSRVHLLTVLAIVILAVLCGAKIFEKRQHFKKYEEMQTTAAVTEAETETETETEPPETEPEITDPDAAREIDFAALKERNPDVVGWIYIPGTVIDYPVLWREDDNDFYLHHDIDGEVSYDGVFLDGGDRPDFSRLQNLFYGHHMKNGTMFTDICKFKDPEFFAENRRAYLYTPDHTYILRTMACLYTDAGAEKRFMDFADRMEFDAYVDQMTKDCSFREIPEGGIDRLFSFVTCSYEFENARTILYCYETDAAGNPVEPSELGGAEETESTSDGNADGTSDGNADSTSGGNTGS